MICSSWKAWLTTLRGVVAIVMMILKRRQKVYIHVVLVGYKADPAFSTYRLHLSSSIEYEGVRIF